MKDYDQMEFHPDAEKLVKILCNKTQNTNPLFFRVMVAYYFSLVASMMRTQIDTMDRGLLPVNFYGFNLATSGAGKGHSTNIIEDQVIDQFRHNFVESTLPVLVEHNLPKIAQVRAARKQTDPDHELEVARAEYEALGPMLFVFDSATPAALKDIRHKLLLAEAGALNLQIDEIGTNLTTVAEALGPYLEMYDVGKIKQKLTKNTAENKRREEIHGRTPANFMAYGTPSRLMDGGKTEEEFFGLLDTGYARRSFFGYAKGHVRPVGLTKEQILAQRICKGTDTFMETMSDRFGDLGDVAQAHKKLQVSELVTLLFIEYQMDCEARADKLNEHEEMRKAELGHRHFKALKLAGAYAFVDGCPEITEQHAYYAIKLAEESGKAFQDLLTRDRPHVKLAKYLSSIGRRVTHADLIEDLPFYKGAAAIKEEMLKLAIAFGYQNSMIIKKEFTDGVEFLKGETLQKTDLSSLMVSYSQDIATGYKEDTCKFEDLHKMTQHAGVHWCNHSFRGGARNEDCTIPGFNMIVLDIDDGVPMSTCQMLLKEYKAMFYTTKSHQVEKNGLVCDRYRVVIPTNFKLELDREDYKEFMKNLFDFLPFTVDEATGQRARKWMSNPGSYVYQDGKPLDVLPFIPKTTKSESFKQRVLDQRGMNNLERWVLNNTGDGNRNNMLLKYAMILVDAGQDFIQINDNVVSLNDKMADKLDEAEILSTIMVSVTRAIGKR